jgi:hypothetical protein
VYPTSASRGSVCLVWASADQGTPVDPPLSVDNRCSFGRFCGEFAALHTIDVCGFDRNYSTHARLSVPSAVFSLCRIDVDAMPAIKPHSPPRTDGLSTRWKRLPPACRPISAEIWPPVVADDMEAFRRDYAKPRVRCAMMIPARMRAAAPSGPRFSP